MNQVHPDASLSAILARITTADMKYRLYSNSPTVDRAAALGDFTESAGTGYAAQTVVAADWVHDSVVAHNASRTANDIAFTCSGGSYTVNGYYITDSAGAILLGACAFGVGIVVDALNPLILSPKWGDLSKFSS